MGEPLSWRTSGRDQTIDEKVTYFLWTEYEAATAEIITQLAEKLLPVLFKRLFGILENLYCLRNIFCLYVSGQQILYFLRSAGDSSFC